MLHTDEVTPATAFTVRGHPDFLFEDSLTTEHNSPNYITIVISTSKYVPVQCHVASGTGLAVNKEPRLEVDKNCWQLINNKE